MTRSITKTKPTPSFSGEGTLSAMAVTHPGLETLLVDELSGIGVRAPVAVPGGVEFTGTMTDVWRVNLASRVAGRLLVRVATFHASAFHELERHASKITWAHWLGGGNASVHFRVTSKKSKLYHERGIAERLYGAAEKTVAVTRVPERSAAAIDDDDPTGEPGVHRFVVRLHGDDCTISIDSSGAALHRRGYRRDAAKAPMRETLAAGLLLGSGWTGAKSLTDPMCGSGTIPIEAALIARRIAPGIGRRFAFERWPGFDSKAYQAVRTELRALELAAAPEPIAGSDRDAGAVDAARANAERAGVADSIEWRQTALSGMTIPANDGWIVTNPPYGGRVGNRTRLRDLYAQLGNVLRTRLPGGRVAMVSADRMFERQTGFDWSVRATAENGGIPIRLVSASITG